MYRAMKCWLWQLKAVTFWNRFTKCEKSPDPNCWMKSMKFGANSNPRMSLAWLLSPTQVLTWDRLSPHQLHCPFEHIGADRSLSIFSRVRHTIERSKKDHYICESRMAFQSELPFQTRLTTVRKIRDETRTLNVLSISFNLYVQLLTSRWETDPLKPLRSIRTKSGNFFIRVSSDTWSRHTNSSSNDARTLTMPPSPISHNGTIIPVYFLRRCLPIAKEFGEASSASHNVAGYKRSITLPGKHGTMSLYESMRIRAPQLW